MKNKKTNRIIILSIIGVVFLVSLIIFVLNYSKDSSSFSILEKKWLKDNTNNIIDISVFNDVPVIGQEGNGVLFDYLKNFTDKYDIEFNKISYYTDSPSNLKKIAFRSLSTKEQLTEKDILLYEDKYVIVSVNNKKYDEITDLKDLTLGILSSDIADVSYYLAEGSNLAYKTYKDIKTLKTDLENKQIEYLVLPELGYLDFILENDLNIVFHLNDLSRKYVLTINDNNTLLNIMKKYQLQFKNQFYDESYKQNFIDLFFQAEGISESEKMSYNASAYNYGYVVNMPLENTHNNEFVGVLSNYLSEFSSLFDVDFKFIKYENISKLKQAMSQGDVDVVFANFNLNGINSDVINTSSLFKEEYVVLTKKDLVVDSLKSLQGMNIEMVANTYLYDYASSLGLTIKAYDNTDEIIRNASSNSILVLDKYTYNYYKNKKLANYNIVYTGILNKEYTYAIRDVNKNKTFSKLFSYYISSVNYKEYAYKYNTNYDVSSISVLGAPLKVILITCAIILAIIIVVIVIQKRRKKINIMRKDEKLKFIDVMTSLKNRNYLNYNIKNWEENVIYPQSFVVVDLNNIKYINDNHGHEEGDNVIKKAASILIVNQEPNTDIIRTDGNEFLIYMVGYDEKKVVAYTRKIYKELKELPYGFGASIGYSMILDDVKSIDDAINEATLEMRNAKEKMEK